MDMQEIRKLAFLRADLTAVQSLLIEAQEVGDPVGMIQYRERLNSIIQEIESSIQPYLKQEDEISHLIDSDTKAQITNEINSVWDLAMNNDFDGVQTKLDKISSSIEKEIAR